MLSEDGFRDWNMSGVVIDVRIGADVKDDRVDDGREDMDCGRGKGVIS